MIVFLTICQIFLINIHGFFLDRNYCQEIGTRCTHGVASKSYPLNSSRTQASKSSPRSNYASYVEQLHKNYDITRYKKGPPRTDFIVPYPHAITERTQKTSETLEKYNSVQDGVSSKDVTQQSRSEWEGDSKYENGDASLFEFDKSGVSTEILLFRDIKGSLENHSVVLSLSSTEQPLHHVICKNSQEEITLIPLKYFSQTVNLVFPLDGKPPPEYSCFEVMTDSDMRNSKVIKIYKMIKPHEYDVIYREVDSNKTDDSSGNLTKIVTASSKKKRQAFWLELQSPTTSQYSCGTRGDTPVLSRYQPLVKKVDQVKRFKKKKPSRQPKTKVVTPSNDKIRQFSSTELQTEPLPQELEHLFTNDNQTCRPTFYDYEKNFIKCQENSTETLFFVNDTKTECPELLINYIPTNLPSLTPHMILFDNPTTEFCMNRIVNKTLITDSPCPCKWQGNTLMTDSSCSGKWQGNNTLMTDSPCSCKWEENKTIMTGSSCPGKWQGNNTFIPDSSCPGKWQGNNTLMADSSCPGKWEGNKTLMKGSSCPGKWQGNNTLMTDSSRSGKLEGNKTLTTDSSCPDKWQGNNTLMTNSPRPGKWQGNKTLTTDSSCPGKWQGNNTLMTDSSRPGKWNGNKTLMTDSPCPGKSEGNNSYENLKILPFVLPDKSLVRDKSGRLLLKETLEKILPKEKGHDLSNKTTTSTQDPTQLSTKFIYGQELHVKYGIKVP